MTPAYHRTMAYRVTYEIDGEEYWADISNDLREVAVNRAMSDSDLTMQDALTEVLGGNVVSVEQA